MVLIFWVEGQKKVCRKQISAFLLPFHYLHYLFTTNCVQVESCNKLKHWRSDHQLVTALYLHEVTINLILQFLSSSVPLTPQGGPCSLFYSWQISLFSVLTRTVKQKFFRLQLSGLHTCPQDLVTKLHVCTFINSSPSMLEFLDSD